MGKNQKNFQGREAFHRMNFLYQASHMMLDLNNETLSTYYGHIMTGIAKKTVLRIDPSIKRTICKGCHNVLKSGKSATVRIKKDKQVCVTCNLCHTVKRFNRNKNYKLWSDNPESIVEVLVEQTHTNYTSSSKNKKDCAKMK